MSSAPCDIGQALPGHTRGQATLAVRLGARAALHSPGVAYLIRAIAADAGLPDVDPHTPRHSCGYYLADRGTDLRTMQDYLGHRDPRHTMHYTRVSGRRFEGLWK